MADYFIEKESNKSIIYFIQILWQIMNPKRRIQSFGLLILTLLNSFADLISISAIIPVLTLLINPEAIANSKFFQFFNQNIFSINDSQIPILILGVYVLAIILAYSLKIINTFLLARFGALLGTEISMEIFEDFLRTDFQKNKSTNSSAIVSNIILYTDDGVASIVAILQLIGNLLNSIFIAFAICLYEPKISILSIGIFGALYLIIGYKVRKILYNNNLVSALLNKDRVKKIQESVSNFREIKLGSLYDLYLNSYFKLDNKSRIARANNLLISVFPKYLVEMFTLLLFAIVVLIFLNSSKSISEHILLIGLFAYAAQKLLPLIQQSFAHWSLFKGTSYALNLITSTLIHYRKKTLSTNLDKLKVREKLSNFEFEKINIKNVSFKYKSSKSNILETFSMEINKGDKVVFFGGSGEGKSTFFDLISGLLIPLKGTIKINKFDINKSFLFKSYWQNMIGYVSQNVILKDDTLLANIAFSEKDFSNLDMEWINYVIKISGLTNYVDSLPFGLKTLVGESGNLISGGQRQRVGIARALYKKPQLLLLDEATSSLDKKLGQRIISALCNSIPYEITIISITHDLATISNFERVFEIKKGQIIEKT